jgi:hypothetical protein
VTTAVPGELGRLTVLRAEWLFDGTSSALIRDPVVVIQDSTIVGVGSGGEAPEGAAVIGLPGTTLLPGLVDTHVHLAFDASADPVANLARRQDGEVMEAMARAGQAALRGGVTTIRDLGDRGYLSLGLRGRPDLPTIVAAGPPITTPSGHCHYLGGAAAPTIEGVRAVREHAARGVDVIKIMASGGNLAGYRVRYVLAAKLVNELVEAADDKQLTKTIARYGRVDLLCIDELGYMELDRRGAELLFQVLTEREEKNSMAIASNESFSNGERCSPTPASSPPSSTASPSTPTSWRPAPGPTGSPPARPAVASEPASFEVRV